jgi:ABC-type transport system substrate-binding protein
LASVLDPTTALTSFKAGEGDILVSSTSGIAKYADDLLSQGFIVQSLASPVFSLFPDSENADSPLSKKIVREAIDYGIDKVAISKALGFGYWEPLSQVTGPTNYAYVPELKARAYNPDQAKKLLADAGYSSGFTISTYSTAAYKDPMTVIQSQLGKIGINVKVEIVDGAKISELGLKGWNNGFYTGGLTMLTSHVAVSLATMLDPEHVSNHSTKRPESLDNQISKALASKDFSSLKLNTQELVKILYDDVTVTPMWASGYINAKYKYVNDDNFLMTGWSNWTPEKVWLNK